MADNPKSPTMTNLLRKLKRDIDNVLPGLFSINGGEVQVEP